MSLRYFSADVFTGRDVYLAAFINLYGRDSVDDCEIGTVVDIKCNAGSEQQDSKPITDQ